MFPPIPQSVQIALGALVTKSVGSIYRVRDVREAPPPIQKNVKHREAVILIVATLLGVPIQLIANTGKVKSLIAKSPVAKYSVLLQSALMAVALCVGEITGRYMTPPLDWHDVEVQEVHGASGPVEKVTPEKNNPNPFNIRKGE